MFRDRSLTLFRVRGVPIRAHWTLLLIGVYLVAELAGTSQEGFVLPAVVWGLVLAVCVFASILLHELAHTFAAIQFGGSVRSITLMVFGGVSQLTRVPQRPAHEAVMAAVGPATSLLLGFGC